MEFRLGELFCGPGGLAVGAKRAKVYSNNTKFSIKHVWATDFDKDSCATYANNVFDGNHKQVVCKDIRKLKFKKLEEISEVDALSFGFPCNDFSIVGEQKGTSGTFGPLYKHCVKAVEHFKPKWFLAENVGGLRNSNEGNALTNILNEFEAEGYDLYPHYYHFEKYLVPQSRHRIIIIGIKKNIGKTFLIPKPFSTNGNQLSCREALSNPPITFDMPNSELTKQSPRVVERLKHIRPGENAFTADLPSHLRLNVNGVKISQIYKRLDPDKPAYTITGSGGGGTHVYHWSENRALTNRERARLQTFPDNFVFHGTKESVRKQIGMAVPPNFSKIIFEAVLKSFANIKYRNVEQNLKNLQRPSI